MKNAGSFCLVKNMTSHNKNLVFKRFPLVKAYYFLAIFFVLKMKIKKKKREFFIIKKLGATGR